MNIVMLFRPKSEGAYVYEDNSLRQGLEKMRRHGYTAVPVIDREGGYVGTVSEGDFLWHMIDHGDTDIRRQEAYQIKNILRKDWNMPVKIDETLDALLLRVMDQNFVPVVDDRMRFMGIITRKDVIKYYYDDTRGKRS